MTHKNMQSSAALAEGGQEEKPQNFMPYCWLENPRLGMRQQRGEAVYTDPVFLCMADQRRNPQ